ncbi:MAG TPA: phosphopantothenoylcysteine decarboxylase [Candidatus Paceibacterota bacterium]|nr:phosphopantothenoylcysteine decarboxylase [Candidatus Paceibacterota bacterium]HQB85328.1 phosphopantothenoylcysteine decarboxylase [Candidatus Pacearchaeota archaeon]
MAKVVKKLLNKKILVTAGPTWVPIDKVRVITNVFGGTLGSLIAREASKEGARVTLLFGPGKAALPLKSKNIEIIRYKYYDDLLNLIKKEVKTKNYEIIIHSSAVADYAPIPSKEGKIKSGKKTLTIKLRPTLKIVDLIKKIKPKIFLVKFKLEVGLPKNKLLDIAYRSMLSSKADIIVANEYSTIQKNHRAYIIDKNKDVIEYTGKEKIAKGLISKIANSVK